MPRYSVEGQRTVSAFAKWIRARRAENDWNAWVRRGILNRTKVANECDFEKSVFGSNPKLRAALDRLETRLRARGILPPLVDDQNEEDRRVNAVTTSEADRQIRSLQREVNRLKRELALERKRCAELARQLMQPAEARKILKPVGLRVSPGKLGALL